MSLCLWTTLPQISKPHKQILPHRFWVMDVVLRCFFPILIVFASILLISSTSVASLHYSSGELGKGRKEPVGSSLPGRIMDQKRLGEPGSRPPICRMKCGKCQSCKAVKVPIKPDLIMSLEYYPEAWRCKCGNKIFMP